MMDEPSEELVERVARAIARGCNLDPDASSAKAKQAGHDIPEWMFFAQAAKEAISAMQSQPIPVYSLNDGTDEFVKP